LRVMSCAPPKSHSPKGLGFKLKLHIMKALISQPIKHCTAKGQGLCTSSHTPSRGGGIGFKLKLKVHDPRAQGLLTSGPKAVQPWVSISVTPQAIHPIAPLLGCRACSAGFMDL